MEFYPLVIVVYQHGERLLKVYVKSNLNQTRKFYFRKQTKNKTFNDSLTRLDITLDVLLVNCFVFKGVRPTNEPFGVACAAA
jgi:hypothetical protein